MSPNYLAVPEAIFKALAPIFADKVFPGLAPDSCAPPYAIYDRIASAPENTLANGISIQNERYQIDVWAYTKAECLTLAGHAQAAMRAIPYPLAVSLIMATDQAEPDVKMFRAIQDFSIWHPRSDT